MQIPFTAPDLLANTSILWNFQTVPQKNLNNRVLAYQRGRLLGGSSSVSKCYGFLFLQPALSLSTSSLDFLIYTRGSKDDYNRYAEVTEDPSWNWENMFPFMLKVYFAQIINEKYLLTLTLVRRLHNTSR